VLRAVYDGTIVDEEAIESNKEIAGRVKELI